MADTALLSQPGVAAIGERGYVAADFGKQAGVCIHCGVKMGNFLGCMTDDGPLHNECVPLYRRKKIERCAHCDNVLGTQRTVLNGSRLHPSCVADYKANKPYEPPKMQGKLTKFAVGRSIFGSKNWKERFFVLSKATGLAYYEDEASHTAGKPPRNVVVLTSETRLITKPTKFIHKDASNPSKEFVIIFFEGGIERRILIRCEDWQEHDAWIATLECYIKDIDNPKDLVEKFA
jgi:hypothetical protein